MKKYKSLALSIVVFALVYFAIYQYTKDKISPLKVSSFVNYYDSDLALQVEDVEYIFPSWFILSKGTLFYKQEPIFDFDKAKFTLSLFSIFSDDKKFKYNIAAAGGMLDGRYSGDKFEMDVEDLCLSGVPFIAKHKIKGDLKLKIDVKLDDKTIKDGGCNFLISEFGFSAPVSYVKDTSLCFESVSFQSRIEGNLLKVNKLAVQGKELSLQSFGKAKLLEDRTYIVELQGKKRFAPTFFEKIKNGFFVGLYLSDAVGKDCYFKMDYSQDGLDYRKIDDKQGVRELERGLGEMMK